MRTGLAYAAVSVLMLGSCGREKPRAAVSAGAPGAPGPVVTASLGYEAQEVRPGDQFELRVEVRIVQGWHIYAVDLPTGVSSPTSLRMELPAGIEQAGDWVRPEPSPNAAGGQVTFVYKSAVTFQCPLRVTADAAPGQRQVRCHLRYQACDQFSCRPPTDAELACVVRIVQ